MMLWVSEQGEKSNGVVNFPGQFGKTGASDCLFIYLFIFGQKGFKGVCVGPGTRWRQGCDRTHFSGGSHSPGAHGLLMTQRISSAQLRSELDLGVISPDG